MLLRFGTGEVPVRTRRRIEVISAQPEVYVDEPQIQLPIFCGYDASFT
jgi:hypothetical protein